MGDVERKDRSDACAPSSRGTASDWLADQLAIAESLPLSASAPARHRRPTVVRAGRRETRCSDNLDMDLELRCSTRRLEREESTASAGLAEDHWLARPTSASPCSAIAMLSDPA